MWVLVLIACVTEPGAGGRSGDDEDPRAELLDLCLESCHVRASGEGCDDPAFDEWCAETCHTYEGLLPDECVAPAKEAIDCWIDEDWSCDGSTSWYGMEQPMPEDEGACAEETEAFYACG